MVGSRSKSSSSRFEICQGVYRVLKFLPVLAPANPAVVVPISPARYEVAFTVSAELHDKYAAFALRTDSLGIRAIYGLPRLSS